LFSSFVLAKDVIELQVIDELQRSIGWGFSIRFFSLNYKKFMFLSVYPLSGLQSIPHGGIRCQANHLK